MIKVGQIRLTKAVDVPNGVLPIGTGSNQATSPEGPTYREYISIPQDQLDDPKEITRLYSFYIVQKALTKGQKLSPYPLSTPESAAQLCLRSEVAEYFWWSFWNERIPRKNAYDVWTLAFWDIRNLFRPGVGDQLISYMVKAFAEDMGKNQATEKPSRPQILLGSASPPISNVIFNYLVVGDTVVDDNQSKLEAIEKILNKYRIEHN
jgi:hypothetical protein